MMVWFASYIFTSSLSKMVIFFAAANLLVLRSKFSVMSGVMCSSCAGSRTLKGYSATSVACFISLPCRINLLWDARPVRGHGSSSVRTPEVQALSATVDGMEPSSMLLCRMSSLTPMMYCLVWGRLVAMLAIVSVLLDSHCLLMRRTHFWAILLAVAGGIVGWMSMWSLNSTFFLM
jgi:hypothetical protein